MNYYQEELTAKYNRQRVREEFELIHIEDRSAHSHAHRTSLFTRVMHSIASWMIITGKQLHKRYEISSPHRHRTSSSFAQ